MARAKAGKRASGEGSIFQRKSDGRWVGAITLDDGRSKRVYGWKQSEVQHKLDDLRARKREGRLSLTTAPTTGAYLHEYIRTKAVTGAIVYHTVENYSTAARQLGPYLGKVRLDKLTTVKIQEAYNALLDHGGARGTPLSAKTVKICHGLLRGAMRQAVKQRLIAYDPTDAVTPPRPARYEYKVLTADQAYQLFEATEDDPLHALWVTMVSAGLRINEALALTWNSLDFDVGTLAITRSLERQKGKGLVLKDCKTDASRRVVNLTGTAVQALRTHKVRQLQRRLELGGLWRDHSMIFPTSLGMPLDSRTAWDQFQKALRKSGLPRMRPHDLRHSAATLMLAEGIHPKVVQEMLGHANISMTLATYSHVLPTLQADAAERLDGAFRRAKEAHTREAS